MQGRLAGKTIIVAGGGGIGDGLAERYAEEGASVLLGDLDGRRADAVAAGIAASGLKVVGVELDGASESSIKAAVVRAVGEFGGLDGFHANFASFADGARADDVLGMSMDDYDEAMRVNARGFVLCTRAALPAMLEKGGGSMVYTSSGAAFIGEPVRVAYAMSKSALHALMRHVAVAFGPRGIRANIIAPGVILHDRMRAVMPQEAIEAFKDVTLLKTRLGSPQDIAAMGALLMSDEGSFITGQVLSVDGGNTMRP